MTQINPSQRAAPGQRRNHEQAYLERVRAVHARTEALHMKKTWIARKIRRSRPHVSSVLNARDRGLGTLLLIEELVAQVEAGEVVPR